MLPLKNYKQMNIFTKTLTIMLAMIMCSCSDNGNDAIAQTTLPEKMQAKHL